MSRTYKDAPAIVRGYRESGKRPPKNWRERRSYSHGPYRWDYDDYNDYYAARVEWWNTTPYPTKWPDSTVGKIAKEQNRLYRHRARQAIREGRYDDIPKPIRNALWLRW